MFGVQEAHGVFISYCKQNLSRLIISTCNNQNLKFLFFSYNSIKAWIQGGNTKKPLGPALHMTAAAEAGILTLIMTNPVWVVKTRLCLQFDKPSDPSKGYSGMWDAFRKIYGAEGVRGLYKVFYNT